MKDKSEEDEAKRPFDKNGISPRTFTAVIRSSILLRATNTSEV